MNQKKILLFSSILVSIISSCALRQEVLKHDIILSGYSEIQYFLENDVKVNPANAASFNLKTGTKWKLVGSIERGEVYKTKDQAVIVNGFNVFEAYVVVSDEKLVGLYLPTEKTFVKSKPEEFILKIKETSDEK